MPRPKEVIDAQLAQRAREALAELGDHKLCIKLQAIISSAEHPIKVVAQIMGISRQTVWVWIKNFRQKGVEGLRDRPKGHRRSKLGEQQWKQVASWLEEGRDGRGEFVHWTLLRLQQEIKKEFGVRLGITPLWRQVRQRGFRQKVARPVHAKADQAAQKRFKKKPRRSSLN